jgi:hypothetical protein
VLDLAAGTRFFERLESLRIDASSVPLHGPQAIRHGTQAAVIIGRARSLLAELGGTADTASAKVDDLRDIYLSLSDVCVLAQCELRTLTQQLERTATRADLVVVVAESTFRKVRRIVGRAQWLLAPLIGRTADVERQEQEIVSNSITVRRLYGQFRRAIVRCTSDDASVMSAMRAAAIAVAALLGHVDAYELRIQDYQLLGELQARIEGWIRENGRPAAGRRIHADVSAFAELTRMVNRRQELRAHDQGVLAAIADGAFPALLGDDAARDALVALTDRLVGLDDALDAIAERLHGYASETTFLSLSKRAQALIDPGTSAAA